MACLSMLTMHFTLGPSLQLGRWDSQGPPAWAEAVLLRQEQPGSKLQEPGPLRHHKICLTGKFEKPSPALSFFFLFSGLSVRDPFLFYFILFFFYFSQTQTSLSSFTLSSWSLPHPGSLSLSSSICSRSLPLLSLILLTPHHPPLLMASITTTLPQAPLFLCLVRLIIHHSHVWLHLLRKGLDFAPSFFFLSHSACLLSWKRALVTSKLCVSVKECVATFTCLWPHCAVGSSTRQLSACVLLSLTTAWTAHVPALSHPSGRVFAAMLILHGRH